MHVLLAPTHLWKVCLNCGWKMEKEHRKVVYLLNPWLHVVSFTFHIFRIGYLHRSQPRIALQQWEGSCKSFQTGIPSCISFFFFFLSFFLEELQLIQGKHCRHVLHTLENCYKLFAIEEWAPFADVKWSSTAGFTGTSKSCSDTELGLWLEWKTEDFIFLPLISTGSL